MARERYFRYNVKIICRLASFVACYRVESPVLLIFHRSFHFRLRSGGGEERNKGRCYRENSLR